MLRFASLPVVVDTQIEQTRAMAASKGCTTAVNGADAEPPAWEERARRMWDLSGAIVRASWMPADLPAAVARLKACATTGFEIVGRAAVGVGLIRIDGDARTQAAAIEQLRLSPSFRHVVIVRGSDELKSIVDVWGPPGDRERLFASLKHALDPNGILNAGRGPL
jgi:hypothetical protein